jgi:hypothetical protein
MDQPRKTPSNNSSDDGERNPPQGILENPHKLQFKSKRVNSQEEEEIQNVLEDDIFLDNIDLYVDIENIRFLDDEEHTQENVQSAALAVQDEVFFGE